MLVDGAVGRGSAPQCLWGGGLVGWPQRCGPGCNASGAGLAWRLLAGRRGDQGTPTRPSPQARAAQLHAGTAGGPPSSGSEEAGGGVTRRCHWPRAAARQKRPPGLHAGSPPPGEDRWGTRPRRCRRGGHPGPGHCPRIEGGQGKTSEPGWAGRTRSVGTSLGAGCLPPQPHPPHWPLRGRGTGGDARPPSPGAGCAARRSARPAGWGPPSVAPRAGQTAVLMGT